jgi:hypothetical protein
VVCCSAGQRHDHVCRATAPPGPAGAVRDRSSAMGASSTASTTLMMRTTGSGAALLVLGAPGSRQPSVSRSRRPTGTPANPAVRAPRAERHGAAL